MEQIQTLSTIRGREVLRGIYREMRFERQLSSSAVLMACLLICVGERDLMRFGRDDVKIVHPLGWFAGVSLWLQEIVNRYYFSTVSSLVYLGAAFLLLIVGAYRFTSFVGSEFVLAGLALEALLLILLFVIMFFSPSDDYGATDENSKDDPESELNQIVREIGEISGDYAAFSNQVDEVTTTLSSLAARQDQLIEIMRESTRQNAMMLAPQPELLDTMQQTNQALNEFAATVQSLAGAAQALHREEVERSVRQEVERLLAGRLNDKA